MPALELIFDRVTGPMILGWMATLLAFTVVPGVSGQEGGGLTVQAKAEGEGEEFAVSLSPMTVELEPTGAISEAIRSVAKSDPTAKTPTIRLRVDGLRPSGSRLNGFRAFINVPLGDDGQIRPEGLTPDCPNYAGTVGFFGDQPQGFFINLDDVLRRLDREGTLRADSPLRVTLLGFSRGEKPGEGTTVPFSKVTLSVAPDPK